MERKSSINFKPVKPNSQYHNEREGFLDYVFADLSSNNETWKQAEISGRLKHIHFLCKEISGRKLQKNAEPIREAVVNLNSNHGLSDLQRLSEELKSRYHIECFQIFIHRDEGKNREELNYHAHMVFDWQDKETGKMRKLSPIDLSQIQTLTSSILHMERGELKVNSNRERLEAIEYKRVQEEKKLVALQSDVNELEKKKVLLPTEIEQLEQDSQIWMTLKTSYQEVRNELSTLKEKWPVLRPYEEEATILESRLQILKQHKKQVNQNKDNNNSQDKGMTF